MNGSLPISIRILRGLRSDHRTLGLVLVVPVFIIYLFSEVFHNPASVAHILVGLFVFILTYLLTAIGFLRERTAGTLDRVLTAPISRNGVVVGYLLGFGVLATVQTVVLLGAAVVFLDVEFEHNVGMVLLIALLGALTALGIGILLSLFADNEFQVQQFMPLIIAPQVILGEVFVPVDELVWYLEYPARAMPVTYIIRGMDYAVHGHGTMDDYWIAIGALSVFALATTLLAGVVVRRVN